MKSAFAKRDTHTYTYPHPLGKKVADGRIPSDNPMSAFYKGLIDDEVMAEIRQAEKNGDPSPAPTITLRIPRSKHDRDKIGEYGQAVSSLEPTEDGLQQVTRTRLEYANRMTFELLVEEWTGECFGGEQPTAEAFGRLDRWTAAWVVACMVDAQDRAEPDFQVAPANGSSSSKTPARGRAGSARASASR